MCRPVDSVKEFQFYSWSNGEATEGFDQEIAVSDVHMITGCCEITRCRRAGQTRSAERHWQAEPGLGAWSPWKSYATQDTLVFKRRLRWEILTLI